MASFYDAVTAAIDASRPKTSGPTVNAHVVRSPKVSQPDFEQMKNQIKGAEEKRTGGGGLGKCRCQSKEPVR